MNSYKNKLVISIDLDEWYHARWVTGSNISRWPDTLSFFRDVYNLDKPRGDIDKPTMEILELLDEFKIKATFFILSEVAGYYPHLVKEIVKNGHEIASHGKKHVDLWHYTPPTFYADVKNAKNLLEDLSGEKVVGYRAPNLIIEDWIVPILSELGFEYDSSVCPSRKLMGKFSNAKSLPAYPYFLSKNSFVPGNGPLFEIPIPVFPYLKLPAATGIMTRVVGLWWSKFALQCALRTGDAMYYFHPFELTPRPDFQFKNFHEKLHSRRTGTWMSKAVNNILNEFKDVPKVTCSELMKAYRN
ncbi:MAG: polysaccharide deacetylase family protein [Ignavibacteriales bacterium]|nr:polysaccharide deacetylase family protein [Ignavibacteriales bacterium]